MRNFIFICLLSLSSELFAEEKEKSFKATGQIRLDHKSTTTTVGDSKSTSGGFSLNRARVVLEGNLEKKLSYRIKMFLDRTQNYDTSSADGIDKALVEAKIIHRISDNFALEFGRIETQALSIEMWYPPMDTYSISQMLTKHKPASSNGASAASDFLKQRLTFTLINSPGYDATGKSDYKVENDDMTAILYWQGDFLDGVIKPIVSYGTITRRDYDASTKIKSEKYTQQIYALGSSFVFSELTLEAEMDFFKNPEYIADTSKSDKSGKVDASAIITQGRYKFTAADTTLIAKYSIDSEKFTDDKSKDSIDTTKISFGPEFRPLGPNFRYHAQFEKTKSTLKKAEVEDIVTESTTYWVGAAASI